MDNCGFFERDDFVWTNDLWFLIYIWLWKIRHEFWLDRLSWRLNEQLWFFNHDDFFWNNDLWFPIHIWMWKIHREIWNDRLHWRLMNNCFFFNVMILSARMIYDSPLTSEYEKYIETFEMIDFIDVWWTVVFFNVMIFVTTYDLWFPIFI